MMILRIEDNLFAELKQQVYLMVKVNHN